MLEIPIPKINNKGFFQPFKQTPPDADNSCNYLCYSSLFHPIGNFQKFQENLDCIWNIIPKIDVCHNIFTFIFPIDK